MAAKPETFGLRMDEVVNLMHLLLVQALAAEQGKKVAPVIEEAARRLSLLRETEVVETSGADDAFDKATKPAEVSAAQLPSKAPRKWLDAGGTQASWESVGKALTTTRAGGDVLAPLTIGVVIPGGLSKKGRDLLGGASGLALRASRFAGLGAATRSMLLGVAVLGGLAIGTKLAGAVVGIPPIGVVALVLVGLYLWTRPSNRGRSTN